jgi:hypothetical protein
MSHIASKLANVTFNLGAVDSPQGTVHPARDEPRPATWPRPDVPQMPAAAHSTPDLPQVFSPAEAAGLLRDLGLREMTECALRTRAYRRQVPFHMNGRRILFTLSDLREIAQGEAHSPCPQPAPGPDKQAARPTVTRRRTPVRDNGIRPCHWRARRPGDCKQHRIQEEQ